MARRAGVRWKSIGTKEEQRLTAGLVHHRAPAWSEGGRWLAIRIGDHEPAWVVVDRRGRVARALPGIAEGGASFAPDGALAFGRRMGDEEEIWLATTPASPPVRLLGGDGRDYRHPAFSPDGTQLAFASAEPGETRSRLHLLTLASGERRALPMAEGRSDQWPAFAPDGSELFFEGHLTDGEIGCWGLRLADQALERVSPPGVSTLHPAPLSSELLIAERLLAGEARLVLIDRREVRERELSLTDLTLRDLREPAVCRSHSGKLRLAFSSMAQDASALKRYDVCVARLRGISLDEEAPLDEEPSAPSDEPAAA
jgi:hypothetical protein